MARSKLPELFHYKYAYDDNFTEEENAVFEQNFDNYYIYDSFKISAMTEKSMMWTLDPFREEKNFEEYSGRYTEIFFYQDSRNVMTTTVLRSEVAGFDFDIVYGVEKLTEMLVERVLEKE